MSILSLINYCTCFSIYFPWIFIEKSSNFIFSFHYWGNRLKIYFIEFTIHCAFYWFMFEFNFIFMHSKCIFKIIIFFSRSYLWKFVIGNWFSRTLNNWKIFLFKLVMLLSNKHTMMICCYNFSCKNVIIIIYIGLINRMRKKNPIHNLEFVAMLSIAHINNNENPNYFKKINLFIIKWQNNIIKIWGAFCRFLFFFFFHFETTPIFSSLNIQMEYI